MSLPNFSSLGTTDMSFWVGEQPVVVNPDVIYSYYPFLFIGNLHNVLPQDVNFLESQGCLRIPTRSILDEFVQQFFLHVHPLMPLFNEGDFWDIYCQQGRAGTGERMSLLVFQAMLFACCNFVSKSSIKALGFPDIRTARAALYRRTKLLFDFDTESSLVCLSQAALLLTYWPPNWSLATRKPNTAWLGVAIQNAKSAEAHIYSAMPMFSPVTEPVEYKRQNCRKRLWWCCVLRDRLVSLGMRRSIQISRAQFDFDSNSGLGFSDLSDEIGRSKVYNSETKRQLIEIFGQLGELLSVLTDLLTLVFPLDDIPGWGRHDGVEGAENVRKSKAALRRWYKAATLRFPMFGGDGEPSKSPGDKYLQHGSVILYTNMMYMFYHSSRTLLCHHELLQIAMASASSNPHTNPPGFSNIYESRHELQDAAYGVTECLNELIHRRLARWLPISAMACTALPLVLHIIDVKLLSQNKRSRATPDETRRMALKQQRLNVLIEAMKAYQPQYDSVDYISETIRHIVNLAQIDPPGSTPSTTSSIAALARDSSSNDMPPIISDWTDILACNPGFYLRLAMTIDISISKGRLAKESDFPLKLRGLFAHGFSPIRALLAGNHHLRIPPTPMPPPPPSPLGVAIPQMPPPTHAQPGCCSRTHVMSSDEEDSASPDSADATDRATGDDNDAGRPPEPFPTVATTAPPPPLDGADAAARDVPMPMFLDIDYALGGAEAALAAYVSQTDDDGGAHGHDGETQGVNAGADDCDMYDAAGDWLDHAWDDDGGGGGGGGGGGDARDGGTEAEARDKELARILLDALRGEGGVCAA
ncbi:putative fungal specific transcription factor domain-containing protein [Rosellinia necatrix]|uniref:Putative fungal specific transcription factor domain-containing protein n=1 Tax=Rosellinia necatrix TaxID=77044 RepID=A0A1W2TBT0_ROSNE|nr:putative fungal specific transcription factor domain-containing protein [Rosellinia necatrix]